uniref:Uncharacterized protein n=1 Tax=Arundo donax TaxID=35708 RepID=A0A0A9EAF7_ARUDO
MLRESPLHKAPYFSGSVMHILLLAKIHAYRMVQMRSCGSHFISSLTHRKIDCILWL